jgi:acyl-CoA synthetase (AMP-forming)/AMP-acid ligase II
MITVPSLLSALAASPATASKPALIAGERQITFAELYARALRRVSELRSLGIGDGSIVAVVAYNEPELFEYFVALGHLGAALMPLSPAATDRELNALIEKADASLCLCTRDLGAERVRALTAPGRRTLTIEEPSAEPAEDPAFPPADTACWVSTTGGSTGTPRLFAMSHERLLTNLFLNAMEWRLPMHGAHLAIAPLAHGIGFSHSIGQLAIGGTVVLVRRYSAALALDAARTTGSCWTAIVPTMLHDLMVEMSKADDTASSLGLVISAGAPLGVGLRNRALAGRRVIEYYGSTELGWVAWTEHRAEDERSGLVGRPTLGATVRVVDEDGAPREAGVIGRVEKRGRPYAVPLSGGASAYRANASAWETSGDVGYFDADGSLILAGREDDMVVVGGQNVYPVEVEAALREHPSVGEVLVHGEASDRLGQQLVALVEVQAGARVDEDELAVFCETRLAKYKRPARIAVVERLPRNAAGKIARSRSATASENAPAQSARSGRV